MATNPHILLGLDRGASAQQIQSAYLHWAQAVIQQSGSGSEPLREIQEAYRQLARPEPRESSVQRPDPLRAYPSSARSKPRGGSEIPTVDLSFRDSVAEFHPSFNELFDRLWSNFTALSRPKAERIESLTIEVLLSRTEAAAAGRARIELPAYAQCQSCGGHGCIGPYECWRCLGHGALATNYPVDILYPAGIPDRYTVQVPLAQFGIENFYLTVCFRVGAEIT